MTTSFNRAAENQGLEKTRWMRSGGVEIPQRLTTNKLKYQRPLFPEGQVGSKSTHGEKILRDRLLPRNENERRNAVSIFWKLQQPSLKSSIKQCFLEEIGWNLPPGVQGVIHCSAINSTVVFATRVGRTESTHFQTSCDSTFYRMIMILGPVKPPCLRTSQEEESNIMVRVRW